MPSRRVYITLNSNKEKDRIIEQFLSSSYSESDFIKETLYRLATNSNNIQLTNINSTEMVQKTSEINKKVRKNTKPKSNNKVQKGVDSNEKLSKDGTSSMINKEQIQTPNTERVQIDINSDDEILKNNEMNQLMEFMG
ncbi:hypothetical protein FDG50_00430 [Clostridium botulinum]|uniref:hypothetical protein n=1 Tax=Clostridium botulinum TaxID=1491 RepID=UPI0014018D7D|nr:hypothetical protein [Clostridium botulinum]MBY6835995.1 hypothetical protein [Clostridium botulinum]NFG65778.1 hypothetical protein [Clostridium botulinum]NFQ22614.1 hypothetical protein [Clostridium botulinum]